MERKILGLTTRIVIYGKKAKKEILARVDTGATKSSIDAKLAKELDLGPSHKEMTVKSTHGTKTRPVITAEINIAGQIINAEFNLADRKQMKYQALIGQNILKKGYLIDPMLEVS